VQLRLLSFLKLRGFFDSIICDSTKSIEDSSSSNLPLLFREIFLDLMVASEKFELLELIVDFSPFLILDEETTSSAFC
jgi:hypothetical protein